MFDKRLFSTASDDIAFVSLSLPKPYEPSSLDREAVQQLRALADKLESGELSLKRFSITVKEKTQLLEVEA